MAHGQRDDRVRTAPGGPTRQPYASNATGDERLASVFRNIRSIAGLSVPDMARRLGTGVDVILNFEAGAVDMLPPWPVTARLVEQYAELGGVDPAPVLTRLLNLQTLPVAPPPRPLPTPVETPVVVRQTTHVPPIEARVAPPPRQAQAPQSDVAAAAPIQAPTPAPIGFAPASKQRTAPAEQAPRTRPPVADEQDQATIRAVAVRRRRRMARTMLALSPVAAILAVAVLVHLAPGPVYAATRALPGTFGSASRGLVDTIVLQTATFKDGLRWIEPTDPRQRKGHRLSLP